ncbi:MAG: DUF2851 family protein [Candidatus Sumerlaeota bacterium]|nr:DUF2851 family protein [Candidatus Sumerlaeota bacterium]
MPDSVESEFLALRETVRARFVGSAAAEGERAAAPARERVPERLAQAIWFERLFRADGLKTASGKPLQILDPGRWNEGPGPDFLAAEISLDGRAVKGDVEVHVEASDWRRHGHERDFAYNTVALHVCLWNDDGRADDELHNGQRIERFEMGAHLFPDLDAIRQTLSPEDYPYDSQAGLGRCHDYFVAEDESLVRRFLRAGGRERMEGKTRRLADQLVGENFGQLLYQALMTAMGFKGNKALFFLLSKRAPAEELLDQARGFDGRERAERMEAILLHVAGLAPKDDSLARDYDPPTLEYLNRVNRHWADAAGYFADRLIPPTRRWQANVRPVNFPARRLAGIAHFVANTARGLDLFTPFLERLRLIMPGDPGARSMRAFRKAVEQLLTVDAPEDYWAQRYTFEAKPAGRPMSLIGASRADSIAFNSLIPLLLLYARKRGERALEEFAWRWFEGFPQLESNNVVRFMRYRLFGDDARGKSLLDSEPMQQGLFQVFHSCCNNRERDCEACYFLADKRERT